jgi:molybdopterin converting factor small subunit
VTVEVELFATLTAYLPPEHDHGGRVRIDLPEGATVADLASRLGIPTDLPRVALVNGENAEAEHRLRPDDEVTFFPPLAGGRS